MRNFLNEFVKFLKSVYNIVIALICAILTFVSIIFVLAIYCLPIVSLIITCAHFNTWISIGICFIGIIITIGIEVALTKVLNWD